MDSMKEKCKQLNDTLHISNDAKVNVSQKPFKNSQ